MTTSFLAARLLPLALLAALPARAQDLPLHLFEYDRAAPPALRDSVIGTEGTVTTHAISYDSPAGGRVTGRMWVPSGSGPFAGVVLAHGAPGTAEMMNGRGIYIARHGAVVIGVDAPFNRREGGPILVSARDSADQVQLMLDLRRAVDILVARRDVDAARLAYVGRSYGGATGALFAAVEPRLKTAILAVADGGLLSHGGIPLEGEIPPPPEGFPAEGWEAFVRAMRPIESIRFVHLAKPGSIFFQNATQDQLVAREAAEALHRAAGPSHTVKWYDTGHPLNPQAHVDQLAWLHERVGTAAPGPEDAAGPQIPAPAPRLAPRP